jgi:hypothetical protein
MAIHVRGLDLSNGTEVVLTKLEFDSTFGDGVLIAPNLQADDMTIKNGLTIGSDTDGNSYDGTLGIRNSNANYIDIIYSTDSTEDLTLSIENTKATLEDGDILVYNTTNSTFKVDNISNYITGGTGNYHVLKVEFSAGSDFATTTVIPEGAQIDRLVINRGAGLTTGTAPLTFSIGDVSNITLATQGAEFDNGAGSVNIGFFLDVAPFIIGTGESGTFRSNWSGAGFGTGSGYGYLFYWTELL